MREELAKVYVGNISLDVTDPDLYDSFERFGYVTYVSIVKDRETGESRGFAFVQFESESSAEDAIDAASDKNGVNVKGEPCTVELSRPKRDGPRGGFRGRGRGRGRSSRGRGGGYSSGDRYGGGRDRYDDDGDRYSGKSRFGGRGGYGISRERDNYDSGRDYDRRYSSGYGDGGGGGYGRGGRSGGYGRREPSSDRYDGYRPRGSSRY